MRVLLIFGVCIILTCWMLGLNEAAASTRVNPPKSLSLGKVGTPAGFPSAFEKIAHRISKNRAEWEDSRSKLVSSAKPQKPSDEVTCQVPAVDSLSRKLTAEELAVQQKYSLDFLNIRMRISLLESRLATADESGQKVFSAKLEQAKVELKSIEDAYQAELKAAAPD